jgi:hypothetical protein
MKKLLYTLIIIFVSGKMPCYSQYKPFLGYNGDTLSYLQENFITGKSRYIGQPFSKLAGDLEFQIKAFTDIANAGEDEDGSQNLGMYLLFTGHSDSWGLEDRKDRRFYTLIVDWSTPIPDDSIRKLNKPYRDENWTPRAIAFFQSRVIKNIKLYYTNQCAIINGVKKCEVCDQGSVNYNARACALSYCDPESPNYDSIQCERSMCDEQSPIYDEERCNRCNPTSSGYNKVKCIEITVNAMFDFNSLQDKSYYGDSLTLQDEAYLSDGKLVLAGGSPWDYTHPHATEANSPSLNPQYITVAARIKFTSDFVGCGADAIVCKPYTSHTAPYYQYILAATSYYNGGSADYTFVFGCTINGQGYGLRANSPKWAVGQWNTVVATYNGSAMKLYVNGSLVATNPVTGTLSSYPTDLFIGKHGNLDYSIPADIDWVKIYNRALSDAEVSAFGGQ